MDRKKDAGILSLDEWTSVHRIRSEMLGQEGLATDPEVSDSVLRVFRASLSGMRHKVIELHPELRQEIDDLFDELDSLEPKRFSKHPDNLKHSQLVGWLRRKQEARILSLDEFSLVHKVGMDIFINSGIEKNPIIGDISLAVFRHSLYAMKHKVIELHPELREELDEFFRRLNSPGSDHGASR